MMKAKVNGIDIDVKIVIGETSDKGIVVGVEGEEGDLVDHLDLIRLGDYASAMIQHTLDTYGVLGNDRIEMIEEICARFADTLENYTSTPFNSEGYVFSGPEGDID